jgi:hypothetical protein
MRTPELELLWWQGCPSTQRALSELREALTELHLDGAEIRLREIRTDDEAVQARFIGSPTLLIDGDDVLRSAVRTDQVASAAARPLDRTAPSDDPADAVADDAFGLTCRVYRRRDGRISPTPDPEDLREALTRAADRVEVIR